MSESPDRAQQAVAISSEEFGRFFRDPSRASILDGNVALGVSGGADSTALLFLIQSLVKNNDAVTVLTVDHGLRPQSASEAKSVGDLAGRFGLRHVTLQWLGEKPASDIQAAARDARYDLMTNWCLRNKTPCLMVAHTLDDQAETFLLRLARGSGVDGLSAMAPVTRVNDIQLIRPLLAFRKLRLEETLAKAGIGWIEDPSNESDRYARVRMRAIMPLLEKEGLTAERLSATADRMASAKGALVEATALLENKAVRVNEAGCVVLSTAAMAQAPAEIGLRLLAEICQSVGGNRYRPRFERLQRAYETIVSGAIGKGTTLSGCRIVPAPETLSEGEAEAVLFYRELNGAREASLPLKAGESAVWDSRFDVIAALVPEPMVYRVGVLAEEGWQQIKSLVETPLPYEVCLTVPALWQDDKVVSVPHLGFEKPELTSSVAFSAVFRGLRRFRRV